MRPRDSATATAGGSGYAVVPRLQPGDRRRFRDLCHPGKHREAGQPEEKLWKLEGKKEAARHRSERTRIVLAAVDVIGSTAARCRSSGVTDDVLGPRRSLVTALWSSESTLPPVGRDIICSEFAPPPTPTPSPPRARARGGRGTGRVCCASVPTTVRQSSRNGACCESYAIALPFGGRDFAPPRPPPSPCRAPQGEVDCLRGAKAIGWGRQRYSNRGACCFYPTPGSLRLPPSPC